MDTASTPRISLVPAATFAATTRLAAVEQHLRRYRELVITWDITAAERDTGDETYDLYITTSDGVSSWDLCHFPQVATTGAKRYIARIQADLLPQSVASNGVPSNDAILAVGAGQANVIETLAAGSVRHGKWGGKIGYSLIVAGTIATGITCSVQVEAR